MRELQLIDLQVFTRLAELGTLTAVARERGVPVSQISRNVDRIETACGTRLAIRSSKGLALTPQGRMFLDYCRRVLHTTDELEGEFSYQAREISGTVRVAASLSVAQYLLVPSLEAIAAKHPALRIELDVGARLVDVGLSGVDVAIRSIEDAPGDTVARRLGTLGRRLYAAPSYLDAHGLPMHPDDLLQHRLITNAAVPALNRWPLVVEGKRRFFEAEGRWRANDAHIVTTMAVQGLGIARLATLVGDALVSQGVLLPVLQQFVDPARTPLYAVTAGERHRLPKIRACVDVWVGWMKRLQLEAAESLPPSNR
jgi:DNA-binding transcriptional LysR family regulator